MSKCISYICEACKLKFNPLNCWLNAAGLTERKTNHRQHVIHTPFLNIIFIAFLIGLNTEQVYISWLCETLSCFANSGGRRGDEGMEGRMETQPREIETFPTWLSDWGPASVCLCVGGGLKSPLRRSLWPLTRTGSYTGVKPRNVRARGQNGANTSTTLWL